MKRCNRFSKLLLAAAATVFCSFGTAHAQTSVLTNGDFSAGLVGWTAAAGGAPSAPGVFAGSVSFNGGNAASYGSFVSQSFTVQVGAPENVNFNLFENNGGVSTHFALVEMYDSANTVIYSQSVTVPNNSTVPVAFSFAATTATNTIRITNTGTTNTITSDMKLDDVVVTFTPLPPNPTVATDASIARFLQGRARALVQNQPDVVRFIDGRTAGHFNADVTQNAGEVDLESGAIGPFWVAAQGSWTDSSLGDQSYVLGSFGGHTMSAPTLSLVGWFSLIIRKELKLAPQILKAKVG